MNQKARLLTLAAVAGVVASLVACAGEQGTHVSRSTVYGSVNELLTDTTDVVVGVAMQAEVLSNESEGTTTLTSFRVEEVWTPPGAGSRIARFGVSANTLDSEEVIVVRQPGSAKDSDLPVPLLAEGERYLLFLNPASNTGKEASHFTVVGVSAGMYEEEAGTFTAITASAEWARLHDGEIPPDRLPEVMTLSRVTTE